MPIYDLTVTMLSPVHIGTGEELSPDEYTVREIGDGQYMLHALDLGRLLPDMTGDRRREFDQAVSAASPTMVRRFIDETADLSRHTRWKAATNPELHGLYQRSLQDPALQLAIHPMTRTGLDARAYIPGSSIKGAIRTAILQQILDQSPETADLLSRRVGRGGQRDVQLVEAEALGHMNQTRRRPEIRADPFRAVRISDCPLPDVATSVDPVDLVSLRPGRAPAGSDTSGIHLFYEMTFSALDDETIQATGTLAIASELATTPARSARRWDFEHCVSRSISAENILDACRTFYVHRLEEEADRVSQARPGLTETYGALLQQISDLGDGEAPIRLGRFSHVECVTLAPPLRRASGGNSRGLAAGLLPMGWAKITLSEPGR